MRREGLCFATGLVWLFAAQLVAGERVLQLDLERSEVRFRLDAFLHSVEGRVPLLEARLVVDPDHDRASGRIVLDATRAETGHSGRDAKMHREVLESDRFPTIVFEPERLALAEKAGSLGFELGGIVVIHGGRHPLVLSGRFTRDDEEVVATGTAEVPYVAWGMKNPSRFLLRVSKQVRVEVVAVGRLVPTDGCQAP